MTSLALIVCTHNPRCDHLERTLAGIRSQQMDASRWEFVLVDNRSDKRLADELDLSWHPRAKIVREETPGLNAARRRGLAETDAPLIVFVDDDNVLDPAYLAEAMRISEAYPFLGAWGGNCVPEYETPPPAGYEVLLSHLALREVPAVAWSNHNFDTCPYGAGLCIRRVVTEHYERESESSALRRSLGRKGANFVSGEDLDMALCAHRLGLGTGLFPSLSLTHLIAARRLTPDYLRRLSVGCLVAYHVVLTVHGLPSGLPRKLGGTPFADTWRRLLLRLRPDGKRLQKHLRLEAARRAAAILATDLTREMPDE